jgi:hypothetical protein
MSNHRGQQFSARMRSLWATLHPLFDLAWIALAITLVVLAWDNTAAATGEVPMRIFLVGWGVAAVILSVESLFGYLAFHREHERAERRLLPLAMHYVVIGAVIGLAVGTTDWTDLQFAGDRQMWLQPLLTVPLLLGYFAHLRSLQGLRGASRRE